jgi:hypothetical protein
MGRFRLGRGFGEVQVRSPRGVETQVGEQESVLGDDTLSLDLAAKRGTRGSTSVSKCPAKQRWIAPKRARRSLVIVLVVHGVL